VGFAADLCISPNTGGSLVASADLCPAHSTTEGTKTETTDPAPFQKAIESTPKPVTTKFTIVIALVVKEKAASAALNNIVKLFVDLVGTDTPTQQDKDDLCEILKTTLTKLEVNVHVDKVGCQLAEKVTVKRNAQYVASLTYPAGQDDSASALVASFVAVAVALVALFF